MRWASDLRLPDVEETGLSPAEVWQGLREGSIAGPRAWSCALLAMPRVPDASPKVSGANDARSCGLASSRSEVLHHAE